MLDVSTTGALPSHAAPHKPANIWGDTVPPANHRCGQASLSRAQLVKPKDPSRPHGPFTQHGLCDCSETLVVTHTSTGPGVGTLPTRKHSQDRENQSQQVASDAIFFQ